MTYGPHLQVRHAREIVMLLAAMLAFSGCTRTMYRRQADREANYLVREKSVGTPWQVPEYYTIQPDPRSRFFDPTDPDFPRLPPAGPHLYQYQLPELNGREAWQPEPLPPTMPGDAAPRGERPELPSIPAPPIPGGLIPAGPMPGAPSTPLTPPGDLPQVPPLGAQQRVPASRGIQLASFSQPEPRALQELPPLVQNDPFLAFVEDLDQSGPKVKELEAKPVGEQYWIDIPPNCLARMLDFTSVTAEYIKTYEQQPSEELLDSSPRVGLRELFELALINSREYQRQKEVLYEQALNVSLERFAYATKFSVRGTTVDTTYTHSRVRGTTVNSLTVPSTFSGDKVLATSGTLVGQFANDILLTFNGPTGFAADVSSELLLDLTQRVFQRDILLEPLIQSERNLVYAARTFARYRKIFFLDVASDYYGILRNYRGIEIDAQNYFAQVRNLQQALEEVKSGISSAPNIVFLNQYERSVLSARSGLISSCNALEQSLDNMKITIGVPTETLINLNLDELDRLTLRDMIEVNRQQASRWLIRLKSLREVASEVNQGDILTADYSLTERLIRWLWERGKIVKNTVDPREVFRERAVFRLDAARLDTIKERETLQLALTATPPKQRILVFQRQVEVIEAELNLISRQLEYADAIYLNNETLTAARAERQALEAAFDDLLTELSRKLGSNEDDSTDDAAVDQPLELLKDQVMIALLDDATRILAESQTLGQNLDDLLFGRQIESVKLETTLQRTDTLIEFTDRLFNESGGGLPPIDISVDQAMITALVQRLDLMNERGLLADDWRAIKVAADELRSRMDLGVSQRIGTDRNRPFSFSMDDSNTRLRMSLDLPLNRKRDRNLYRRSLINYNVGLRGLMRFEDDIKLNIRREMRALAQARDQFPIAVASAALAEEQVLSTRLQLVLGMQGVRANDLVEAFNDSRAALGDMVGLRIAFILDRAQFALELEAMMLDDTGYWPQINDPAYQPEPNGAYPWNAGSAYGDFPTYLRVSREFRRMLNYPPPGANPSNLQPETAQ